MSEGRIGITLLLSLALWAPSGLLSYGGELDLMQAGFRYLGALAFAWFAVRVFDAVVSGYGRSTFSEAQITEREIETDAAQPRPSRRREDDELGETADDAPALVPNDAA